MSTKPNLNPVRRLIMAVLTTIHGTENLSKEDRKSLIANAYKARASVERAEKYYAKTKI